MKKYTIRLVAVMLVFWLSASSLWAATPTQIYAGNQLRTLGILIGSGDGSLQLDNNITRAQVATIMVRVLAEHPVLYPEGKKFVDVSAKHWGKDYIQNAYKIGMIQGYPDNTFKPENNITYAEVVAIMVNALGQKESINPELSWPENYLTKGKELGIIPMDSTILPDKKITRGEMALIVWDTILVKNQ
ncbi:MAG: S-layer homology domain-containing protein [Eubacteriales bacterium]|nr:S-layer homology domain-containing protein [Eubacteriales bacterium]